MARNDFAARGIVRARILTWPVRSRAESSFRFTALNRLTTLTSNQTWNRKSVKHRGARRLSVSLAFAEAGCLLLVTIPLLAGREAVGKSSYPNCRASANSASIDGPGASGLPSSKVWVVFQPAWLLSDKASSFRFAAGRSAGQTLLSTARTPSTNVVFCSLSCAITPFTQLGGASRTGTFSSSFIHPASVRRILSEELVAHLNVGHLERVELSLPEEDFSRPAVENQKWLSE